MNELSPRIKLLDGFRAIAIISVMLFHYFSRWAPQVNSISLYPYNNKYSFFGYGFLGVQFFFMISGFVIFFTLEKTDGFVTFWKKRAIRLLPSMLVASLLTFIAFRLFDDKLIFPESHRAINFLQGITFINPDLINYIFRPKYNLNYLSGSYWSLWPEIQFYFFASVLFYISKKKFARNFSFISIFIVCFNYLMQNSAIKVHLPQGLLNYYSLIFYLFNLIRFLPFFSAGMLFYLLYKNNNENIYKVKLWLGFFIVYIIHIGIQTEVQLIYMVLLALFACFIYYPKKLSLLNNRLISRIGISSYFLYLIHEHIGVLLINKLGKYFLPLGMTFPLLLICFLIFFSILYSEKVEKRISFYLKKR